MFPPVVSKSVKSYIESDLVSKFETVRDGFRRTEDSNRHALDLVLLDTRNQRLPAKVHNSKWWPLGFRTPSLVRNGNPYFKRILGRELMKTEGREKTNDSLWNMFCCLGQGPMLGHLGI